MNKKEYLKKLDELNFDKNYYSIISGGLMLIHGFIAYLIIIQMMLKVIIYIKMKRIC